MGRTFENSGQSDAAPVHDRGEPGRMHFAAQCKTGATQPSQYGRTGANPVGSCSIQNKKTDPQFRVFVGYAALAAQSHRRRKESRSHE